MEDGGEAPVKDRDDSDRPRVPYEPPRIVWTEPYEPMSFGLSCLKVPGQNTECNRRPMS
jgi:hypothetical protein